MKRRKLEDLVIDKVALCHQGANQHAEVAFFKAADTDVDKATDDMEARMAAMEKKMARMMEMMSMKKSEEEVPAVEAVEESAPEAEVVVAEEVEPEVVEEAPVGTVPEPEPVLVAASVEKSDETVDVEKAEIAKALADARAEIAKMKHAQRQSEFIAKAKSDLDNLGDATELGNLLLDAADNLSDESYKLLERTLKAASAQVGSGDLFKQIGDATAEPAGEAYDRIVSLAKAKVEAGEAKTVEIGILQVSKEHPELVLEHQNGA